MRIIAGKYRGRKLRSPRGLEVRPTGDRLRQRLFDILGSRIIDSVMADVFAGTGAVGIEALSRGAREVVFVEKNSGAGQLIRQNLRLCGITAGFQLITRDVFSSLRQLRCEGFAPDIVFLDPPYDWQPYRDLLELVFSLEQSPSGPCIVIEHHSKAGLPVSEQGYARNRLVRQGDHCLSFYVRS